MLLLFTSERGRIDEGRVPTVDDPGIPVDTRDEAVGVVRKGETGVRPEFIGESSGLHFVRAAVADYF